MKRRLLALVALVVGAATVVLAVVVAVSEFPRGLVVLACVVLAGSLVSLAAARATLTVDVELPSASPPASTAKR